MNESIASESNAIVVAHLSHGCDCIFKRVANVTPNSLPRGYSFLNMLLICMYFFLKNVFVVYLQQALNNSEPI